MDLLAQRRGVLAVPRKISGWWSQVRGVGGRHLDAKWVSTGFFMSHRAKGGRGEREDTSHNTSLHVHESDQAVTARSVTLGVILPSEDCRCALRISRLHFVNLASEIYEM